MSTAEEFLRDHFARQRELAAKATEAVATMSQANIDMIRACGMGVVAARSARTAAVSEALARSQSHGRDDTPVA